MTWPAASEPLSERLWRRYGVNAIDLLSKIENDNTQAELLIENAEYTRCEIEYAAANEMIINKGLKEACEVLFGDKAEERLQEYIDGVGG